MSNITYDYMEQYIRALVPENCGILKELEEYASEHKVPIIQKEVANFIKLMIEISKPKKILELGTAIGYSAIVMASSADSNCRIVTIERDEEMVKKAEENINRAGLKDNIEIIKGDCLNILENMEDKYDMIFMDAGKGHYNHFFPHCLRLLKDDGVLIADNVLYKGMVASRELVVRRKITIVKRMKAYLDIVCNNSDLITTVIPMGDGIAVTKRRNS